MLTSGYRDVQLYRRHLTCPLQIFNPYNIVFRLGIERIFGWSRKRGNIHVPRLESSSIKCLAWIIFHISIHIQQAEAEDSNEMGN